MLRIVVVFLRITAFLPLEVHLVLFDVGVEHVVRPGKGFDDEWQGAAVKDVHVDIQDNSEDAQEARQQPNKPLAARVRDVHEALCMNNACAFTTVQTLLRIMAEKGLVSQRAKRRTLYYKAKYTSQRAASRFLHKVFDGSVEQLVLSMLQSEKTSAAELQKMEQMISEARRKKQRTPRGES
jgi:predicted transcriptional regulator